VAVFLLISFLHTLDDDDYNSLDEVINVTFAKNNNRKLTQKSSATHPAHSKSAAQ